MRNNLAIIDLDGTLIDTKRANYEAYKEASAKQGLDWIVSYPEFSESYFGKSYKIFLPEIYDIDSYLIEQIHKEKIKCYKNALKFYGKRNESLINIIEKIRTDYYIAMVTTASKENVKTVINLFLKDCIFDLIISGDDVEKLKPDMEAWNKARTYFGIDVDKTIIFDDIEEYIRIALNYGICAYKVHMV